MTKLLWAAVIGAAICVLSMLGFMVLAASNAPNLKYVAPVFYVAATAALFWRMSRPFRLAGLLGLGVLTALGSVVTFQSLEFWRTGGVLKGTTPFTWDHLSHTAVSLGGLCAWYGLVAVATAIVAWEARSAASESGPTS